MIFMRGRENGQAVDEVEACINFIFALVQVKERGHELRFDMFKTAHQPFKSQLRCYAVVR